jgi:hypothetical protein
MAQIPVLTAKMEIGIFFSFLFFLNSMNDYDLLLAGVHRSRSVGTRRYGRGIMGDGRVVSGGKKMADVRRSGEPRVPKAG